MLFKSRDLESPDQKLGSTHGGGEVGRTWKDEVKADTSLVRCERRRKQKLKGLGLSKSAQQG